MSREFSSVSQTVCLSVDLQLYLESRAEESLYKFRYSRFSSIAPSNFYDTTLK
jgi:hypothetical protein